MLSFANSWIPVIAYYSLVSFLSSLSDYTNPIGTFENSDKLLHVIVFSGLGFLTMRAVSERGKVNTRLRRLIALCLVALLSALDEWHQYFVPGRNSSALDWTADVIGGLLGIIVFSSLIFLLCKFKPQNKPS